MASSRIFVRNLPPNLTEGDFKSHFSKQHQITDAKFIAHRRIGYVGYRTPEDAEKAVKYFNKSFIRMSKIGVELARPTSDSSLPIHQTNYRNDSLYNSNHTNASINTFSEERREENPLKRKRDGLREKIADPKLKEFLGVMQRPSKSKTWLNETPEVMEDALVDVDGERQVEDVGAESEDEYQTINKKSKPDKKDVMVQNRPLLVSKREMSEQPPKSPDLGEDGATGSKSDADWLRSRTNRLLGLVDEDEDGFQPRSKPTAKSPASVPSIEEPSHVKPSNFNAEAQLDGPEYDEASAKTVNPDEDSIRASRRLFLRNLPYSISEDDLREKFDQFGSLEEVHVPMDNNTGSAKGFAYILFSDADNAVEAWQSMDGSIFQGRLLHVLPGAPKRENKLDEYAISKLPLKQQRQIRRKAEATTSSFNWNALYMNTDAVMSSISSRLGVDKSTLLDPTSSDAAVKQALAETHIIQESKNYFAEHGVDLEAFKSKKRGDTAILVKNFPFGTNPDELRKLFEEHGQITRFLMPPSGVIAIIEFALAPQARSAFKTLAYRKMKDSVLFLEPAPKDVFSSAPKATSVPSMVAGLQGVAPKLSTTDLLQNEPESVVIDTTTLFVRNLNFSTTTQRMTEIFSPLDGFMSARVKTKTDPKKPGQTLSMGFGFLEFSSKETAHAALGAMNGYVLDGHKLDIRASQKALDAAEERRKEDKSKALAGRRTKIIIKNLPFEASKKDVRALFGAYGQLRSVRVPKKFDSSTRGFAFAEFTTPREAQNAMDALRNTHLLGRRLALAFAAEDAEDAEEELERMQKKVGSQIDKVAIQKLTGAGRRKFNVSGDDPEGL